ncbi:LOW QUALITY PROTEIN: hypothetical protein BC936DRAFT_143674 [Jimgerdemannia flammicorona]|uniref:Methyltransferase-domain-containing protein n=1 Tax=Jimgerdemannia flammicorona TaxID=994334 RepID=A0A432ZYX8_9FUNG|nr:LOW QUALITY PROTEIN: hypothetical protein BC936DRAFT_143674 [Jimgerdemannia flammicorona]
MTSSVPPSSQRSGTPLPPSNLPSKPTHETQSMSNQVFFAYTPPKPALSVTRSLTTPHASKDTPSNLTLRLVGSHPLWAHHLWNASKILSAYLDEHKDLCRGKTVLELGAGAALPSLVAAANGANKVESCGAFSPPSPCLSDLGKSFTDAVCCSIVPVVITDYPDKELIDNIEHNAKVNLPDTYASGRIAVQGYVWGTNTAHLLSALPPTTQTFDLIILSDLVFNHSQHHAMLRTCRSVLTPCTGSVLVFYTHHRPLLAEKDLKFFDIAILPEIAEMSDPDDPFGRGYGFCRDKILEMKAGVMFAEDPGDEDVRATVHGWKLWLE